MKERKVVYRKLLGLLARTLIAMLLLQLEGGKSEEEKLCLTKLSNKLESKRSVCASVYVRKPVGMRRVSALGSWFLSPVSTRRSADCVEW